MRDINCAKRKIRRKYHLMAPPLTTPPSSFLGLHPSDPPVLLLWSVCNLAAVQPAVYFISYYFLIHQYTSSFVVIYSTSSSLELKRNLLSFLVCTEIYILSFWTPNILVPSRHCIIYLIALTFKNLQRF